MKRGRRRGRPMRAVVNARHRTVQALYQWQLTDSSVTQLLRQFQQRPQGGPLDLEYFHRLVEGCVGHDEELRGLLTPLLDRPLKELDPVELAILLIGSYELAHCPEVPWRVVINEAVEAARVFGNSESTRYVNGVLDRAARALRDTDGPPLPGAVGTEDPDTSECLGDGAG